MDPSYYTALAQDPAYQSVGMLEVDVFVDGHPAIGSGTLVAPDWVLTAAHVLDNGQGARFDINGQTYTASRWVQHPKYDGELYRGNDLALIQLSSAVADVTPAQLYRKKKEFNREAVFVGFGRTGNGLTGVNDDINVHTKRAGTNVIDGQIRINKQNVVVLDQKLRADAKTFAVDFDAPGNPLESRLGSPNPTALEYLIAPGDSGGGVFIDDPTDKSGPLLAGIHSSGKIFDELDDSDYGDLTGHTRVSHYAHWIDQVLNKEKFRSHLNFQFPSLSASDLAAGVSPETSPVGRSIGPFAIPEPATGGLLLLAAGGLLARRRRR